MDEDAFGFFLLVFAVCLLIGQSVGKGVEGAVAGVILGSIAAFVAMRAAGSRNSKGP